MRKIKRYKVNKDNSLMLAVSFVKNPAIESKFLALEKEEEKQKYVALNDDYRHVVYGAVLRPDFYIYRNDGNEEYYLQFDKEAIEVLAEKFMTQGRTQNFTEAHQKEVDDISVIEVWTKSDMLHDKSIALGLDPTLEVGTLFFGAKVYNDEIWQKVLDGTYEGFSVEAIVDVNELQFEEQAPAPEPAPTAEPAPVQEPVVETPVQEEPTVEVKESILDKILNFINPSMDKPTETPVDEPKPEEPKVDPEPEQEPVTEPETKPEPQINPLEEVVKNLQEEIKALKDDKDNLLEQIREMGKKPSVEPTNLNPKGNGNAETGVNSTSYQNWRDSIRKMME